MSKRRKGTRRNRAGMLPGEARRRSLVSVERTVRPGEVADRGDLTVQDNWIVGTRRIEGVWTHIVELRGQVTVLPGRVIEAIERHRDSIIKEERSRRARERAVADAERAVAGKGA